MLLVGMGAVSTTTIAGVLAVRRGLAKPIGSLTQMGTVRLGKRTEGKSRMVYLQLGHGPEAFNDVNYRKLLAQSIRWTAQK